MAAENKIEKIESLNKVTSGSEIDSIDEVYDQDTLKNQQANKDHFDNLMTQERKQPALVAPVSSLEGGQQAGRKPSLMEEVTNFNKKVDTATKSNPKNIVAQANELIAQMEDLKTKLATPNLEIKSSVQTLIKGKLSHIDESLKIALNKAGVEYVSPNAQKNLATPIERFLGFVTEAQAQLEGIGKDVDGMALARGEISPAAMIAIQVKLGYVQNQVEFFTALLNQALQSTKTIMNIQV